MRAAASKRAVAIVNKPTAKTKAAHAKQLKRPVVAALAAQLKKVPRLQHRKQPKDLANASKTIKRSAPVMLRVHAVAAVAAVVASIPRANKLHSKTNNKTSIKISSLTNKTNNSSHNSKTGNNSSHNAKNHVPLLVSVNTVVIDANVRIAVKRAVNNSLSSISKSTTSSPNSKGSRNSKAVMIIAGNEDSKSTVANSTRDKSAVTNAANGDNAVTMQRTMNTTRLPKSPLRNPRNNNSRRHPPSNRQTASPKHVRTHHTATRNNVRTAKNSMPAGMRASNAAHKRGKTDSNPPNPAALALLQSRPTQAKVIPCPLRSRQRNGLHRHCRTKRLAL